MRHISAILLPSIFLVPTLLTAQIKIDVDGRAARVNLTAGESSSGLKMTNAEWAGKLKSSYLCAENYSGVENEWKKYEITFTPDLGGEIVLALRRVSEKDKNTIQWLEYRNFKVTGAAVKQSMVAPVNACTDTGIQRASYAYGIK
jgi:hypothetical protein